MGLERNEPRASLMVANKFEFENTFLRVWSEVGFDLEVRVGMGGRLFELGIDLTDINYVLQNGAVFRTDMLENRGLWHIRGEAVDGLKIVVTVLVNSEEYRVALTEIDRE